MFHSLKYLALGSYLSRIKHDMVNNLQAATVSRLQPDSVCSYHTLSTALLQPHIPSHMSHRRSQEQQNVFISSV